MHILGLLVHISLVIRLVVGGEFCDSEQCGGDRLECGEKVTLEELEASAGPVEASTASWQSPETTRIFFVETSGRPFLNPRQACAVESALAVNGGGEVAAVVVTTSKFLDLAASNATCQLYYR